MKAIFVTDNGLSSRNDKYYYTGANIKHYQMVTKNYEKIVFFGKQGSYNKGHQQIDSRYKVILFEFGGIWKKIFSYSNLIRSLYNNIKDSDIVFCYGINGSIASIIARICGVEYLYYIGGNNYDTLRHMENKSKRMAAKPIDLFTKYVTKRANYVHYVDSFLERHYPTKGKKLFCPSADIKTDNSILLKRKNKIDNMSANLDFKIGLIGYVHNPIKGIDTLIKAISLMEPNAKVTVEIVGRGNSSWLEKISCEKNISSKINFLGELAPGSTINKWLDTLDLYVQPSLTEGMPRATMEAMARCCPVISSNVGGLSILIPSTYTIIPGDYKELAKKIERVMNDRNELLSMANNNYNTIQNYSKEKLESIRNQFYRDMRINIEKNCFNK